LKFGLFRVLTKGLNRAGIKKEFKLFMKLSGFLLVIGFTEKYFELLKFILLDISTIMHLTLIYETSPFMDNLINKT